MHVSPETLKTLAFVGLMLLVALYMHLTQAPRREPRSLVDVARHHREHPPSEGQGPDDSTAPGAGG